jgi:DinB superfamily
MTTTAPAVSQLLFLLDEAFEGQKWHSLLNNLRSVTPDDWTWVPPGGRRSIRDIVMHIGGAKLMYHNLAFGDASLNWDDPVIEDRDAVANIPSAIEWLRHGHEQLRHSIAALADDELELPRKTHLGLKETRWIISVLITHDLYHAGEINHIRCLRQQDDE